MSRTDLTEQQWAILAPLLPQNPERGHADKDHRPVLNGIIWREKTGAPWRDIPERYGPWQRCHDRFTRWSRSGVWAEILAALQLKADAEGKIDWEGAALDSTHVKAHRSAVGARKQPAKLEKRGPSTTSGSASVEGDEPAQFTFLMDGNRRPLSILVSA
ncbi:IS5 family transposase [Deinococcus taeanensis]|uniref:IS5 family transposase n=1 Tax=Deinococcus taeanensis TaxID=2737050 RepID=UPI001CDCCD94|nr:IS5 family transposase [Deinococcus taeanensis]UBV42490.1 IS5 family transposase [Deinococcus taeanensis]